MQISIFIFITLFTMITFAETKDFNIPLGHQADIIKETSELKLEDETSVQEKAKASSFYINIFAGYAKPNPMVFESHGNIVNYNFDNNIALFTYQFNHYLFDKWGRWGWLGSAGYSYSQYNNQAQATVLHILPLDVGLSYRGEWKSTQAVVPYLNLTYSNWIYFQRGVDEYNTSVSYSYGAAAAGLAFNLNKIGILSSRNEAELSLQYKRLTNNSYVVQVGGTLAL